MDVVMIFKYGKRFRFAPPFNYFAIFPFTKLVFNLLVLETPYTNTQGTTAKDRLSSSTDRNFLVRFDIKGTKFPDLPLCRHSSATSESEVALECLLSGKSGYFVA